MTLPLPPFPPSRYPHYRFDPDDMKFFARAAQRLALEAKAEEIHGRMFDLGFTQEDADLVVRMLKEIE